MDNFSDILNDILNPTEDSNEDFNLLVVAMEEEELARQRHLPRHQSSILGHRTINRGRHDGDKRLYRDYFSYDPMYPPHLLRRRFRMNHPPFCRIVDGVVSHNDYFRQRTDTVEVLGLSSIQKVTTALRMLAYGQFADSVDEAPNNNDNARLLTLGEQLEFPVMLESIDSSGHASTVNYSINGHDYIMGYYLANGIYPGWSTFAKTISTPQSMKNKHFAMIQEARRKDVERAFGVL
ncbi:uncharacterized protein LOC120003562 [Tripterygium wilfordii]|uniref:uncharacterized protein LOC120003562 n=1 Tax=Tripterygium wilfordii TaxID=458696 RepID=UPI0018F8319E|nr:uncharacterized protein LOC120003562 [Tripterygium wilfordii]